MRTQNDDGNDRKLGEITEVEDICVVQEQSCSSQIILTKTWNRRLCIYMLTAKLSSRSWLQKRKGDRRVFNRGALPFMLFPVPEIVAEESTNS